MPDKSINELQELIGNLYDDLYGDQSSLLDLNTYDGDIADKMTSPPDKKKSKKHKLAQIHARIDDGELVLDLRNPLLPFGVTFYNVRSLQMRIREYLESCMGPQTSASGKVTLGSDGLPVLVQTRPLTLAGLANSLGIQTRLLKAFARGDFDTVQDKYSHYIQMAAQQIEEYAETRLYDKNGYQGGRYILDSAFGRTIGKETADIKNSDFDRQQRIQEFILKVKQLGLNVTDNQLDIVISTKERRDGSPVITTAEILNLDEADVEEVK